MYMLAEDLKVGQLICIFLSLQHEANFILGPLSTKNVKHTDLVVELVVLLSLR